ncbi:MULTISPECIES: hypothetical protein [unclassified Microcoleus]|uniref:hypothetical protein n=1 Tax=unclassified Microcoleus TaxID=2642155 RepID=UPI002FD66C0C
MIDRNAGIVKLSPSPLAKAWNHKALRAGVGERAIELPPPELARDGRLLLN